MPDKLKELLLQRPPDATNPYQGRGVKTIPWKEEDAATRFMGGFTGDDGPGGGIAGLLGVLAGTLNPVDDAVRNAKTLGQLRRSGTSGPLSLFHQKNALPQVEQAFQQSGKYTPEVSSEMGRLIGEMIQDPKIKMGWQEFHKLNPEATGHVRQLHVGAPTKDEGLIKNLGKLLDHGGLQRSYENVPVAEREWAGEIEINPYAVQNWFGRGKTRATAHELQHQAQQMLEGADQANNKYELYNKLVGYENNPYEKDARAVANQIVKGIKKR